MTPSLQKLVSVAGPALSTSLPQVPKELGSTSPNRMRELIELLHCRNGFYAFESALHVFPAGQQKARLHLEQWNRMDFWKQDYDERLKDFLFFAEDICGEQFGLVRDKVVRFIPETGDFNEMAPDLEHWAAQILADCDLETGYQIAHEWQLLHGRLQEGTRLVPVKPFVIGGAYDASNLSAMDAVEGMRYRAYLAAQIRDLPDGTEIVIRAENDGEGNCRTNRPADLDR